MGDIWRESGLDRRKLAARPKAEAELGFEGAMDAGQAERSRGERGRLDGVSAGR